jgi:iron complex outermembrane receptor protein
VTRIASAVGGVFLLVSIFLRLGHAETPATSEQQSMMAKQRYEAGMARFRLDEYEPAIAEWKEGFRIKPVPEFLYNIAQAYRLSKQYEQALSFYRKYLSLEPKAANKGEVERHIAALSKLIDDQKRAATAPPISPLPTAGASKQDQPKAPLASAEPKPELPAEPKPEPRVEAGPRSIAQPPAPTEPPRAATAADRPKVDVIVAAPAPAKRPVTKQPWFWGVVGGAAVVVVAAVVVGVVVGTQDSTRALPGVSF